MLLPFVPFINELHRFNGLNIQAGCQPEPFEPSRLTCWWDCSYLGERALAPLAASFCSVSVSCGFGQIDSRRLVIDPVGGAGNHWDGHAVETFGASTSLTDQAGTDTAARRAKLESNRYFDFDKETIRMKRTSLLATSAFIGLISISVSAQEVFKGEWTGRFDTNKFWVSLKVVSGTDDWMFGTSFDLQKEKLKGLPANLGSTDVTPVHFELLRDAGTVVFDGMMRNGSGLGDYQFTPSRDYIASMKSMGYDNLTSYQLLRLALRDVSRGFVKEMHASGYQNATVDEIVRLRNHNVTPEFIAEMKALGLDSLSAHDVARLSSHSINAAFIREMKTAGYEGLSADKLVRLRNHNIDTAYIKSLGDVGYKALSVDDLIRMRNHSVTPAFVGELRAVGYSSIPAATLIRMKNHSVTPAFVGELKSIGYDNIPLETLIRLRSRNVTAAFIKQLADSGYKDLTADDLIYIRDRGVEAYKTRQLRRAR